MKLYDYQEADVQALRYGRRSEAAFIYVEIKDIEIANHTDRSTT